MDLSGIIDLGKTPVSDINPAGDDISLEPEYELVDKEIKKLSSPTSSGEINWQTIIKYSKEILSNKSKNFLIACYLSYALYKTDGLRGLSIGVHVIKEMLENYWENMYPSKKRMRGRQNAIYWWAEKIDTEISSLEPESWDADESVRFINDFKDIDSFLLQNIEEPPILSTIIEKISSLIENKEETVRVDDSKEITQENQKLNTIQEKNDFVPDILSKDTGQDLRQRKDLSETEPDKLLKEGLDIISKSAILLIQQGNLTSIPFRINRFAAWLTIQDLPPSRDGKTLIPPPEERFIAQIKSIYGNNNWKELLEVSESRIYQYLFWLDISRYVYEALSNLGSAAAADSVTYETKYFVQRLKGIENLTFSDGTPFADFKTKEWLRNLVKEQSVDEKTVSGHSDDIVNQIDKEISEAHKMINENKLDVPLNRFIERINHVASIRERVLWEIGLCRILFKAGKTSLYLPYLHNIIKEIDEFKIEKWEPDLAIDAFYVVLTGLMSNEGKKDDETIGKILNKLIILNPLKAFEFL